jgi:hypothetical protein
MKTLDAILRCEMKPTPTTERISRICFIIATASFVALMILTFMSPR